MGFVVVDYGRGTSGMFLRLEGPFAYPKWVSTREEATALSKRSALTWAACVEPHIDASAWCTHIAVLHQLPPVL